MIAIISLMWTRVIAQPASAVLVSSSAPLPKIKATNPWPKPLPPDTTLTVAEIQPTIAPTRTFLAGNYERAIAAIYCEIETEWIVNEIETDPFEKLHFLPVSIELLAKLFDCIDVKRIPHGRPDNDSEV